MNPPALHEIAAHKRAAEAKRKRAALFAQCRAVLAELGDDVSGFALVAWTRDGDLRSAIDSGYGPLRPAIIPTLAADALNRHIAVLMAPAVGSADRT